MRGFSAKNKTEGVKLSGKFDMKCKDFFFLHNFFKVSKNDV